MNKKRIVIKDGVVCGFADEVSFKGLDVTEQHTQRVSHIIPSHFLTRLSFYLIRAFCSDNSFLAAWTRTWRCQWIVVIDGSRYGGYSSRAEAIAFEKEEIYRLGKLDSSVKQIDVL